MKVDFNEIRLQALVCFDRLTGKLNASIQEKTLNPVMVVYPEEIRHTMDQLRSLLLTIACVHQKDDPEFKDVSGDTQVDWFFPEEYTL